MQTAQTASWSCYLPIVARWGGVLQTGQAAARQMVEQNKMQPGRGGCIINMSSVNAVIAIPTIAGYNASKGGVNNLTRSAWLPYKQCMLKLSLGALHLMAMPDVSTGVCYVCLSCLLGLPAKV